MSRYQIIKNDKIIWISHIICGIFLFLIGAFIALRCSNRGILATTNSNILKGIAGGLLILGLATVSIHSYLLAKFPNKHYDLGFTGKEIYASHILFGLVLSAIGLFCIFWKVGNTADIVLGITLCCLGALQFFYHAHLLWLYWNESSGTDGGDGLSPGGNTDDDSDGDDDDDDDVDTGGGNDPAPPQAQNIILSPGEVKNNISFVSAVTENDSKKITLNINNADIFSDTETSDLIWALGTVNGAGTAVNNMNQHSNRGRDVLPALVENVSQTVTLNSNLQIKITHISSNDISLEITGPISGWFAIVFNTAGGMPGANAAKRFGLTYLTDSDTVNVIKFNGTNYARPIQATT